MPIRATIQGRPLGEFEWTTPDTMRRIGDAAIQDIRTRTVTGRDVAGAPFQRYTPAYQMAKARYRAGWTPRKSRRWRKGEASVIPIAVGQSTNTPDLTLTGEMLNAMEIRNYTSRLVSIGFTHARATTKALAHNVDGAGKSRVIREFFGVSQSFLDKAAEMVKAAWRH